MGDRFSPGLTGETRKVWRDSEAGACTSQHSSPEGWQQTGRPLSNPRDGRWSWGWGRETEAECQGRTLTMKLTVMGRKYPSGRCSAQGCFRASPTAQRRGQLGTGPEVTAAYSPSYERLQVKIILNGIEPGEICYKIRFSGRISPPDSSFSQCNRKSVT